MAKIARSLTQLALAAALFMGTLACSAVYSPKIVGDKPVELDKWMEGAWVPSNAKDTDTADPNNQIILKITDAEGGMFTMDVYDEDLEARKIYNGWVRKVGDSDWELVNLAQQKEQGLLYSWMRVTFDSGSDDGRPQITAWFVNGEKVRHLVEAGKLHGVIKDKDSYLQEMTPEQEMMFASESEGVLYEWGHPFIFVKVRGSSAKE